MFLRSPDALETLFLRYGASRVENQHLGSMCVYDDACKPPFGVRVMHVGPCSPVTTPLNKELHGYVWYFVAQFKRWDACCSVLTYHDALK